MTERIIDERPQARVYTSFAEYLTDHPEINSGRSSALVRELVNFIIKENGHYDEILSPKAGEYSWGDHTEIRFWDSPVEFAREHAQDHPMRSVRKHFVAELAKKMASRFNQGYLIEVVGLRDKDGRDISCAMSDEKCPRSVYHAEMERRAEGRRLLQETSRHLKSLDAAHEATKNSKLIFKIG
jgi:hypothetical protein